MAYGVVRTDNLAGTTDGSKLVSFKYNDGTNYAAIENGMVLKLDTYLGADTWKAVAAGATQAIGKLILVAGVELFKDFERPLDEFINEAGAIVRGYVLQSGDIFSVTADALDDTPTITGETPKKYIATAAAQNEWDVVTADTNAVAECIAIDTAGDYTMYVYRVL